MGTKIHRNIPKAAKRETRVVESHARPVVASHEKEDAPFSELPGKSFSLAVKPVKRAAIFRERAALFCNPSSWTMNVRVYHTTMKRCLSL